MLQEEFKYYVDNQEELVKLYSGKYLVIIGTQVVGVYDSEIDAYTKSVEKYELGKFLIQKCSPGKNDYTQTFHSRVVFA